MNYFVTGATGFIGKRLVAKLLLRPESVVHILVRTVELPRLDEFREYWGVDEARIVPIVGDLSEPNLGVSKTEIRKLKGKIAHFFHLAAVYDRDPACLRFLDAVLYFKGFHAIQAHRDAHPEAELQVYPGAGHAFNRDVDPRLFHAASAALARKRTLAFLESALR